MSLSLNTLFTVETAASILAKGLEIAVTLGLPVTSWRAGDPTRSLYHYQAEILATQESTAAEYIKSGFLDSAEGDWLTILAKQVYNVDRVEATAAEGSLELSNSGGGFYVWDAGDITFKSSATGATYHNTTSLTLAGGESGSVNFTADDVGSDYSVAEDEIDELVTTFQGVSITSSDAATATDEQTDESLRETCRSSVGAMSPNGPADAYVFVALSSDLTGTTEVTRASADGDTDTGDVTVYVAGPSGPVTGPAITAVEDAIAEWATPLGITPEVVNVDTVDVAITVTVDIYQSVGETESDIEEAIETAIETMFAELPIGGNDGFLHVSHIIGTIKAVYPAHIYNVTVSAPASNVAIGENEIAVIDGTQNITVNLH